MGVPLWEFSTTGTRLSFCIGVVSATDVSCPFAPIDIFITIDLIEAIVSRAVIVIVAGSNGRSGWRKRFVSI